MEFRWIHTGTDVGVDLHYFCCAVISDGYEVIPQVQMIICGSCIPLFCAGCLRKSVKDRSLDDRVRILNLVL